MRPALCAALLRDPQRIAQRLVQCRSALPGVDAARLFGQQPDLLLLVRSVHMAASNLCPTTCYLFMDATRLFGQRPDLVLLVSSVWKAASCV